MTVFSGLCTQVMDRLSEHAVFALETRILNLAPPTSLLVSAVFLMIMIRATQYWKNFKYHYHHNFCDSKAKKELKTDPK